MLGATATDLVVIGVLAQRGWLMAPASASAIGVVLGTVLVVAFLLDLVKAPLSRRIRSTTDDPPATRTTVAPLGQ